MTRRVLDEEAGGGAHESVEFLTRGEGGDAGVCGDRREGGREFRWCGAGGGMVVCVKGERTSARRREGQKEKQLGAE